MGYLNIMACLFFEHHPYREPVFQVL